MREILIGAALACALSSPAPAAEILLKDFKRMLDDPQKEYAATTYMVGVVNGITIGAAAEAKMQTGHSGRMKSLCPDFEDRYSAEQIMADVRALMKAHPEMPDDTYASALGAYVVGQRYKCQ